MGVTQGDTTTGDASDTNVTTTQPETTTSGDTTTGGMCIQIDLEDNDTETEAQPVAAVFCGLAPRLILGTFEPGDEDWFTFDGVWGTCGNGPASYELDIDINVDICLFLECVGGQTKVTCEGGSTEQKSPVGNHKGCCGNQHVELTQWCTGPNDNDVTAWLAVDDTGPACVDYTIDLQLAELTP